MKLVQNWPAVLKHAWSVRLLALAIVFQVADAALPYLQDYLPEFTFRALTFIAAAGALGSRFIQQRKVTPDADKQA